MRVAVTGARGFLGRHVVKALDGKGVSVVTLGREQGDLRDSSAVDRMLCNSDVVVHLGADVGGVGYLRSCPGRAFHDNFAMGLNVIKSAINGNVRRLVLAGTPCSYASDAALPLSEHSLVKGVPSGDTGPYGYAKLAASLTAATLCRGTPTDAVTVIPSNLYGPGDTFDEDRGHVVAALIRKALIAAELGRESFEVWGDGSATRDFVYVADVADAIAHVALSAGRFDGATFNLGSGRETSIREIAEVVAAAAGPDLRPHFTAEKPVGYVRRVMAVSHAADRLGYRATTGLPEGIGKTVLSLRASGAVAEWAGASEARAPSGNALKRSA